MIAATFLESVARLPLTHRGGGLGSTREGALINHAGSSARLKQALSITRNRQKARPGAGNDQQARTLLPVRQAG